MSLNIPGITERIYHLVVRDRLSPEWTTWFDGVQAMIDEDSNTRMIISVPDSAGLYGVILQCRDLGLDLISVHMADGGDSSNPLTGC